MALMRTNDEKKILAEKPQKIKYVAGDLASVNCN